MARGPSCPLVLLSCSSAVACLPRLLPQTHPEQVRNAASLCYTALLIRVLGFRNRGAKVR